jgi:anti-sigma regulatory factor (Ser/Thr protein kinase)
MISLKFQCPLGEHQIVFMRDEVAGACAKLGLDAAKSGEIVNLADELCCNVMEYSEANEVELSFDKDAQGALVFTVLDDGKAFDPVAAATFKDESAHESSVEDHMGLWIMSKLKDNLKYSREDGKFNKTVYTTTHV